MKTNICYNEDCLVGMKKLPDNSIDLVVTDPPAGISFMNRKWDDDKGGRDEWIKWLKEIMIEVHRVMKPGAHGFVWALPRTSHWTAMALEDAGFEIRDCIIHTFSSGFPKSYNIGKSMDKKLGNERKVIGRNKNSRENCDKTNTVYESGTVGKTDYITKGNSLAEGWGTALKPACEYWWMIRKPLSEPTVVDNVLKWGTGGINIDACRIPVDMDNEGGNAKRMDKSYKGKSAIFGEADGDTTFDGYSKGRFPANLLVQDDVLNDGKKQTQGHWPKTKTTGFGEFGGGKSEYKGTGPKQQAESYSRYFDLDVWAKKNNISTETFPFIITPKSSKKEKNAGCESLEGKTGNTLLENICKNCGKYIKHCNCGNYEKAGEITIKKNHHPTVKPLKLMSYLITLGSREGDVVLDPFTGSGTTLLAAKNLKRNYIGYELEKEYHDICLARLQSNLVMEKKKETTEHDFFGI